MEAKDAEIDRQQRELQALTVLGKNHLVKMTTVKVTAVSGFIEQNQKRNYHQSTPSQPPHNPSKFKELAETIVC